MFSLQFVPNGDLQVIITHNIHGSIWLMGLSRAL